MVTGFPDVRLTPYIGAVVLNEDLQSRAGVSPVPTQAAAGFCSASVELSLVAGTESPSAARRTEEQLDTVTKLSAAAV